jgi:hypothetical protein
LNLKIGLSMQLKCNRRFGLPAPATTGTEMEIVRDLYNFVRERKKFWLVPVIFFLLILGFLIVIGGGSSVAPFIYTLF